MTNKRLKLVPAVARLDAKPIRARKAQRLRQHRQAQAWQRQADTKRKDEK